MLTRELANEVKLLKNQLGRGLEPFFDRFGFSDEDLVRGNWVPPVDVLEESDDLVVRVELPGVKQEEIDISFAEGVLTIKGERTFDKETESRKYHRIERVYGTFSRSFTLPRSVAPEKIAASFTDGILEIIVPKREEAKPRQIRIDVK